MATADETTETTRSTRGRNGCERRRRRRCAARRSPLLHDPRARPVRRGRVGDARRVHPRQGQAGVRAEGRRVPEVLVADGDEHRRPEVLPRPHGLARPRAQRQADDRPRRRHDRHVGPRGRLLRERGGGADVRGRAEVHPRPPARRLQLAGLVQRRLRGEAAVLGVLHPLDRRLDGVDPRLDPPRGRHLPRRLGLRRQPLEAALVEGAAVEGRLRLRARSRSCAAPTRPPGTIKSGGKTRRAAKMVVLDVDHPDVEEFIWCKAHEEEKARVLEAAGYDMSLDSPDWASIQYQNANNSVRVTDAFMEAAADGRRVEPHRAHRRHRRRHRRRRRSCCARSPRRRGSAPTRACSTTRRSTSGTRCRTRRASTRRTRAASTCRSTTRRATSRR